MATKKSSPAMEFVLAALKKNPDIEYGAVKDAAGKKGLTVFPIMYGRAKALLGLVAVSPRGSKKKAKAGKGSRAAKKKISRRAPRKEGSPIDSLHAMIEEMQDVAQERDRYQKALEEIGRILEGAL